MSCDIKEAKIKVLGMDFKEAGEFLLDNGITPRLASLNGHSYLLTMEMDADRLNLIIENDIVTDTFIG
jgi:hypothetical protein